MRVPHSRSRNSTNRQTPSLPGGLTVSCDGGGRRVCHRAAPSKYAREGVVRARDGVRGTRFGVEPSPCASQDRSPVTAETPPWLVGRGDVVSAIYPSGLMGATLAAFLLLIGSGTNTEGVRQ